MRIKKYLKQTISLIFFGIFLFCVAFLPTAKALEASKFPIKIHLGKFTYKNPQPVVMNESKDAGTNYDPHFSLKDPEKGATKIVDYGGESGDAPLINTIEKGEAVVFPRIHGLTIIKLSYLKWAQDNLSKNNINAMPQLMLANIILKNVTDPKIVNDYYVAIPNNYQQFKLISSGVPEIISLAKTFGVNMNNPFDFYSGISYVKTLENQKITAKIIAELQGKIPGLFSNVSSFNIMDFNEQTIENTKTTFNIKEDTDTMIYINPEQKKLLDGQLANFASGACYEIRPTGNKNLCKNTIKQNCPTTQNLYFLHGISCEQLNTLFAFPEHSAAINVETNAYKEQIEPASLKEKTLFKPQVSFGGISEGILLPDYINIIYKYLMTVALVVTGFMIFMGGFQYMMGQKEGLTMIKNAFIGTLLMSCTYLILKTVNPAVVNMDIIDISEINRKTFNNNPLATDQSKSVLGNSTKLADEDKVPYKDPFNFQIPEPTAQELQSYSSEKIWNTHYYARYFKGADSKTEDFKYPLIGSAAGTPVLLWTNSAAWCEVAMEGSSLFKTNKGVVTIGFSGASCKANIKKIRDALGKTVDDIDTALEQTNLCGKTPAAKAPGGATPKCSWWYSHPISLYSYFSILPAKNYFGGVSTGGAVIPLRSVAVNRGSYKSVLLKYSDQGLKVGNKTILLIYIPDAKGAPMIAPDGNIIAHDGYFWVSDSGSLVGPDTKTKIDVDGTTKITVGAKEQIDMFTGPIIQTFMDGEKMHKVYIIPKSAKPDIYEKFYALQKQGFSW